MASGRRFDCVIRGGTVLDGTGAEAIRADVGILGDRIEALEMLADFDAERIIQAEGFRIAPGFIDIHTHSDISVTYDPGQSSALGMGVTTQVVGNCGLSMGMVTPHKVFEFEKRWLAPHGARIKWNSFAEHLELVESIGVATNYVPLAAHGTLRKLVVGVEDRQATSAELVAMQAILATTLEAGAWGFSSGLEYPPSAFADENELAELCKIVARYGGFYATHLRNEGDTLVESVQEALNVVERAGLPLQLSHHKAEGRANWRKVVTTLKMIDEARNRGLDVQMDQYPYTAFMTALSIQILPREFMGGSNEETTLLLSDIDKRDEIANRMRQLHPEWDDLSIDSPWHNIQIGVCRGQPEIQGMSLAQLSKEAGANPIDFALQLLAETEGYVSAVNFAIDETDIAMVMRHAFTSIGSDGVGTHPEGLAGQERTHPRTYGTFARTLGRYVRELGVLSEAEAIHKMTGLPAKRIGLEKRGVIAPGNYADLTLYDPEKISDVATFDEPHQYSAGISRVFVNGEIALENGVFNTEYKGRVLRRQGGKN